MVGSQFSPTARLNECLCGWQVYGALEEADYVAGLAAIRREEPSLEEMIHQHTVMANFQVIYHFTSGNTN